MEYRDELGRRRDCHFCISGTRRVVCTVLKDFYNSEKSPMDLCGDCPFYKTDSQFWEGWNRRR